MGCALSCVWMIYTLALLLLVSLAGGIITKASWDCCICNI
jgi:hypothetical protein